MNVIYQASSRSTKWTLAPKYCYRTLTSLVWVESLSNLNPSISTREHLRVQLGRNIQLTMYFSKWRYVIINFIWLHYKEKVMLFPNCVTNMYIIHYNLWNKIYIYIFVHFKSHALRYKKSIQLFLPIMLLFGLCFIYYPKSSEKRFHYLEYLPIHK